MALCLSATEADVIHHQHQQQQQMAHIARARQAAEWMSSRQDGISSHHLSLPMTHTDRRTYTDGQTHRQTTHTQTDTDGQTQTDRHTDRPHTHTDRRTDRQIDNVLLVDIYESYVTLPVIHRRSPRNLLRWYCIIFRVQTGPVLDSVPFWSTAGLDCSPHRSMHLVGSGPGPVWFPVVKIIN